MEATVGTLRNIRLQIMRQQGVPAPFVGTGTAALDGIIQRIGYPQGQVLVVVPITGPVAGAALSLVQVLAAGHVVNQQFPTVAGLHGGQFQPVHGGYVVAVVPVHCSLALGGLRQGDAGCGAPGGREHQRDFTHVLGVIGRIVQQDIVLGAGARSGAHRGPGRGRGSGGILQGECPRTLRHNANKHTPRPRIERCAARVNGHRVLLLAAPNGHQKDTQRYKEMFSGHGEGLFGNDGEQRSALVGSVSLYRDGRST